MTRPLNSDPLRNFKFLVNINNPVIPSMLRMGFMTVSGLAIQSEVIPYREGGNNTTTRKMPGQTDFGPIGLSRGMLAAPVGGGNAGTREAWDWFTYLFSVIQGGGANDGSAAADFRCTVQVDVLQHPVTKGDGAAGANVRPPVKARFEIYNAWPMALAYSDLDAGGNAVMIEQITLAHEGFRILYSSPTPGDYALA